jgi:hypothetical protein
VSAILASQSVIVLSVIGVAAILWGLFVVWVALTDRWDMLSRWYEENKDSKIGFWSISADTRGFRSWFIVFGVCCAGAGVAALVGAA